MEIQNAYNISGLIDSVLFVIIMLAGLYIFKKAVVKATIDLQVTTSNMQNNAITALNDELSVVKGKIDGLEKENRKLEQVIQTICEAMKSRGLDIRIDGNTIHVKDGKDSSTVRINET